MTQQELDECVGMLSGADSLADASLIWLGGASVLNDGTQEARCIELVAQAIVHIDKAADILRDVSGRLAMLCKPPKKEHVI